MIVTSRDPSWAGVAVASELSPLSLKDATAFLLARHGGDDAGSAREIARLLDRLPLALEQACAYAERGGKSLAQYLALLARKRVEVSSRGEVLDYPATVASTWELSFQALEASHVVAAELLEPPRLARSRPDLACAVRKAGRRLARHAARSDRGRARLR